MYGVSDDEVGVRAGPAPITPTVLEVEIEEEGTWRVEYGQQDLDHRSPDFTGRELAVRGLKADTAYRWRVVGTDANGEARSSSVQWYVTPPAPAVFPRIVRAVDGDPGFEYALVNLLLTNDNRSAAAIIDRDGDYVWWVLGEPGVTFVTPQLTFEDGEPVVGWVQADHSMETDIAKLVHVPISGKWRRDTRLEKGHHDVVEHEDGTVAFLAHTFDYAFTELRFRKYTSDQIRIGHVGMQEGDPTDLLFDMFEDFGQRPKVTCSHISHREITFGEEVQEWTHANSLLYVPDDDAYLVNDKYTDWMYEVDRQTGELKWVMNGRRGDFTNPDGSPIWQDAAHSSLWSHAHTSEAWSGGAMMFDNGDHRTPQASRVMEVAWNTDTMVAEPVWIYDEPEGRFTQALGDAHKLPDDRVLVTWAAIGTVEVVERDFTPVWRLELINGMAGRIVPLDGLY